MIFVGLFHISFKLEICIWCGCGYHIVSMPMRRLIWSDHIETHVAVGYPYPFSKSTPGETGRVWTQNNTPIYRRVGYGYPRHRKGTGRVSPSLPVAPSSSTLVISWWLVCKSLPVSIASSALVQSHCVARRVHTCASRQDPCGAQAKVGYLCRHHHTATGNPRLEWMG